MEPALKILILEDSITDTDLIIRLLKKEDLHSEFRLAMNRRDFLLAFEEFAPDLILSDNSLPQFDSTEALKIARHRVPNIPFILVTGTVSEEFAANIIKAGADDYILKDRMARLPAAIEAVFKQRKAETNRKEAEDNLKSLESKILEQQIQEQKKVARAIIKAQDKERNYIGLELHDNVNQILAAAKMHLSVKGHENEAIKELVAYPLELIESSIQEIRLLCQKLVTPLKNINLEKLIMGILDTVIHHSGIKANLVYAVSNEILSDDLKLNIYRIIQEQINNIVKHAEAKHLFISIRSRDRTITIIVADDGKGFEVEKKKMGIGISNITNRIDTFNGKIKIQSSVGNGCKIQISIPL
ncbi:MAG TPA: response regulator [Puia sp.]|nr:response regulator [Puia sp.]